MRKIYPLLIMAALLPAGCTAQKNEEKPSEAAEKAAETSWQGVEVVAENLRIPWSIQKSGDIFYISERKGSIARIEKGNVLHQRVILRNPLAKAAEAGLLGFILDPGFQQNHRAYAYYTYSNSQGQFNRVITLNYDSQQWTEDKILLDRIPSAVYHHGGRLKIGPDEKLYITTGDATFSQSAQDLSGLNGKILRMNLDGSIPSDNPLNGSFVFSYGHRNPQGLAWNGNEMYETEHGDSAHDEINRILASQNYGWPVIRGNEKRPGMFAPLFQTGSGTWAPSGMVVYNDKLYIATLRGNSVQEFDPALNKSRPVITGVGRIRDVFIDGEYLYFVSNNTDGRGRPFINDDKLYRVLLDQFTKKE